MIRRCAEIAALPLLLLALPSTALAQDGGGAADALREVLTTALAVAFVCALALVSLKIVRRLQTTERGATIGERLRFVRALPVGPRERVVVVEWRGKAMLLGVSAGAVSVLGVDEALVDGGAPGPVAPSEPVPTPPALQALLARVFPQAPAPGKARGNPS